ncbi:MAG: acyltransferase family protein [Acidimicrobiales bacterium]
MAEARHRNMPALDGLRALAVAGVISYHLGFGWARGGYLGVDLFFALSGYLITSLLLEEHISTDQIRLGAFWARRIRRLMPALFLLLAAIALFVVIEGRFGAPGAIAQIDLGRLRADALATLLYVANWHAIFAHQSYFAQFASPSPFEQTWSLAIEEQFYILWPPLLVLIVKRAHDRFRFTGVGVALFGAAASALVMALLYRVGTGANALYFGTETRAFDLLLGAALGFVVAGRPEPGPAARRWLHLAALPALGLLLVFWAVAGSPSGLPPGWMFEGGFLCCAALGCLVIADVRQVRCSPLGRLLSLRPLRYIGRISYGIYLWHWPVIVYMTESRTGLAQPWLDSARLGATMALAVASYHLVEAPVRRRPFPGRMSWAIVPASAAAMAGCLVLATTPAIAAPAPRARVLAPASVSATVSIRHNRPGRAAGASVVPGAGGFASQSPILLRAGQRISRRHPLRVMLLGDSVMVGAELGLDAALGSTGEVRLFDRAIDGFGLSTDPGWRQNLPYLIARARPELIVATWSWDESCTEGPAIHHGPCALQDPLAYTAELEAAVRLMLHSPGVCGVIFLQFPLLGPALAPTPGAERALTDARLAGEADWAHIVASLPSVFPGKVMYLPVGSSLLWHGRFSSWLPPETAPNAPPSTWVRVRMVDNVHMCPAGVVRQTHAVLADLTALYHLTRARSLWWRGAWTESPRYNTPPGSCPADHPPGS